MAIVDHKAGQEILILAGGPPRLVSRYADHFVSDAHGSIPRTVLRCEDISQIFRRELQALVEGQLKRSVVRLQKTVGTKNFILQLRVLPLMAGFLVAADVPPGPAKKPAVFDVGD